MTNLFLDDFMIVHKVENFQINVSLFSDLTLISIYSNNSSKIYEFTLKLEYYENNNFIVTTLKNVNDFLDNLIKEKNIVLKETDSNLKLILFKNLKEREIIINEKDKSSSEKINITFILSK